MHFKNMLSEKSNPTGQVLCSDFKAFKAFRAIELLLVCDCNSDILPAV